MQAWRSIFSKRYVAVLLAGLLLFSMAFHAFVPHHHQHFAFGEGIQAATHGQERKLWFVLLLLGLAVGRFRFTGSCGGFFTRLTMAVRAGGVRHSLQDALRRGIMHPKICG